MALQHTVMPSGAACGIILADSAQSFGSGRESPVEKHAWKLDLPQGKEFPPNHSLFLLVLPTLKCIWERCYFANFFLPLLFVDVVVFYGKLELCIFVVVLS